MLNRFILAGALLLIGCSKPESTVPAVAQPVAAWEKRLAELTAAIKPGMTEDEVTKAAGEANRTKTLMTGGDALVMWEYDLGENNRFKVRFDKNSRVASARLDGGMVY